MRGCFNVINKYSNLRISRYSYITIPFFCCLVFVHSRRLVTSPFISIVLSIKFILIYHVINFPSDVCYRYTHPRFPMSCLIFVCCKTFRSQGSGYSSPAWGRCVLLIDCIKLRHSPRTHFTKGLGPHN